LDFKVRAPESVEGGLDAPDGTEPGWILSIAAVRFPLTVKSTSAPDSSPAGAYGSRVTELWRPSMARGTVKWFNSQKGYGFIQPQSGGKDVFVHISAVEKAGLTGLNEGQTLEYEEVSNRGKSSAENLKVQR
jgi:CspA family cold shock protein